MVHSPPITSHALLLTVTLATATATAAATSTLNPFPNNIPTVTAATDILDTPTTITLPLPALAQVLHDRAEANSNRIVTPIDPATAALPTQTRARAPFEKADAKGGKGGKKKCGGWLYGGGSTSDAGRLITGPFPGGGGWRVTWALVGVGVVAGVMGFF